MVLWVEMYWDRQNCQVIAFMDLRHSRPSNFLEITDESLSNSKSSQKSGIPIEFMMSVVLVWQRWKTLRLMFGGGLS
jgi:hypothetical protein